MNAPNATPSTMPRRTRHVARYQWRNGLMESEPGYRIQGTAGHWVWLSREDAWEAAQELATLLDEDAAAVDTVS